MKESIEVIKMKKDFTSSYPADLEEKNELLEKIKYYEYETDFLRQMVVKSLKAEAEARAEIRKLKRTIVDYEITIEALRFYAYNKKKGDR